MAELTELAFAYERLKSIPGATLLDCGARHGMYCLLAGFFRDLTVHAFEPQPTSFANLVENIRINELHNVHAYQVALLDMPGKGVLKSPPQARKTGLSTLGTPLRFSGGTEYEVEVTTLDWWAEDHDIRRVAMIKLDVEGAEAHVLRGGAQLIQQCRPMLMIELVSKNLAQMGGSGGDVTSLLKRWGYSKGVSISRFTRGQDWFFWHREEHAWHD